MNKVFAFGSIIYGLAMIGVFAVLGFWGGLAAILVFGTVIGVISGDL